MPFFRIKLLGQHAVTDGDGTQIDFPSGKPFALLACLLLWHGPASREAIGALLWPGSQRERRLQSVRHAIWLVRGILGERAVIGEELITVDPAYLSCDIFELRAAILKGDPGAIHALWSGSLLSHFRLQGVPSFDDWVEERRHELGRAAGSALLLAARKMTVGSDPQPPLRWLTLASKIEPLLIDHRLYLVDMLMTNGRLAEAEQELAAARHHFPEDEFAQELEQRTVELRRKRRISVEDDPSLLLSIPEFVGRARELSRLAGSWQHARQKRTARAIVRGSAGSGKTRLVTELFPIVERDGGRSVVVKATLPGYELPWGAVATLVLKLSTLPGANGVNPGSKLVLNRLVPSWAKDASAAAATAQPEAAAVADAVRDLISAVAYESELCILLDDAQWIDKASLSLLTHVISQMEDEPVLYVLTVRVGDGSDSTERTMRRLEKATGALVVHVHNFSPAEVAEFLAFNAGLLGGIDKAATDSDGVVGKINSLSRGNPLFLVEILKALRDDDMLIWADGRWQLRPEHLPGLQQLPGNVHALLSRRLHYLSPEAMRVGTALAHHGPLDYEAARKIAGLRESQVAAAFKELVQRGVAIRMQDGFTLTHDEIADVLRELPREARARAWSHRMTTIAGMIVILACSVAAVAGIIRREPLYGGGTVYVVSGDSLVAFKPPRGKRGEWREIVSPVHLPFGQAKVLPPFRTVYQPYVWFGVVDTIPTASPYAVEFLSDGGHRIIERHDRHDTGFADISPDGRWILYTRDDPQTEDYDLQLRIAARDGSEARTLRNHISANGHAGFSRDGLLVATSTHSKLDSLIVLSRTGELKYAEEWSSIHSLTWCTDKLAFVASDSTGKYALHVTDLSQSAKSMSTAVLASGTITCSPDGSALLVHAAPLGVLGTVLIDLETGDVHPFPAISSSMRWLPDIAPHVPLHLDIDNTTSRLDIGGEVRLIARLVDTGGDTADAQVTWISRAPDIASVLPTGRVVGNRQGNTTIVATYGGLLADSLDVTVSGRAVGSILYMDDFVGLDTANWSIYGEPAPEIASYAGRSTLRLTGDGNYADGILLRPTFRSGEGLTAELDFMLYPFRDKWQRIEVSFCEPRTRSDFNRQQFGHYEVFARYPGQETVKFDPSAMMFGTVGAAEVIQLSSQLPSRDWVHIALQLQPDGFASLVVNHRRIATSALRMPNHAVTDWSVCIGGAAVGVNSYVRNFRLWRGMRY